MIKIGDPTPYTPTDPQALDDCGMAALLRYIRHYADADFSAARMHLEEWEIEHLAALAIQRFTQNLDGKLLASYLNAIRHGDASALFDPIHREIPPAASFPSDRPTPRYREGDRVCWQPLAGSGDWGTAIGRCYSYIPECQQWGLRYLIWLDADSPSARWTPADTAWEADLKPYPPLSNPSPTADVAPLPPLTRPTLRTPSSRYRRNQPERRQPQPLGRRELDLIDLYSSCNLKMTPQQFYNKWSVTHEQLARICFRSLSTVRRWFVRPPHQRHPNPSDLRHLALVDFLFEHFEEIPNSLLNVLCPKR
jgi:hypothetical protein